jgi:acyl-CoA thioesterase-1
VEPELPNVLLIGDSISMGYTLVTRAALRGEANVFRPPVNCGPTTRGLEQIDHWLGDRRWDVIHFNFGLHDLKFMGPKGENLADPEAPGSRRQVPPEEYRENLRRLIARLKRSGAVLIWRETTPVPSGARGRLPGEARLYNSIADEVMRDAGDVMTDPFFRFASQHAAHQRPANVHYTREGSRRLGEHVAEVIRQALSRAAAESGR